MRKIFTFLSVIIFTFLTSCQDTKSITDLQDQARRLEAQVQKERQENAELSSYRLNIDNQFKRKNEDYVKCQEDEKDNFEFLSKKYRELESDYDKLREAYKTLTEANDANKEMSTRAIVDLEERIKQIRSSKVTVANHYSHSRSPRVKRKKRRR